PSLDVQNPKFFHLLSHFYCTGRFPGLAAEDLRNSPLMYQWLEHEVFYGEVGRNYVRTWLSMLAGVEEDLTEAQLNRGIRSSDKWQRALIRDVGERLWNKVKHGVDYCPPPLEARYRPWQHRRTHKRIDFRFFNINSL